MKAFLLVMVALLFGCNHLDRGKIIEKHYEPSRVYPILIPIRVGKITTFVPMFMHDDEDYVFTIKGDKEGETETIYVSQHCYQSLTIGDNWVKDSDCSYSDDNNTQTEDK